MANGTTQSFSIFVPLVFVVITQLSSVVEGVEYKKLSGEGGTAVGRRPILFPENRYVPSFGRLNAIHGLNLLLIHGCFLLTVALLSGLLRSVLLVLVSLVWMALPLLETDVFGEILEAGTLPTSLYFHGGAALVNMAYAVANVTAIEAIERFDLLALGAVRFTTDTSLRLAGGAVLFALEWYVFLALLEWDIECEYDRSEWLKSIVRQYTPFRK